MPSNASPRSLILAATGTLREAGVPDPVTDAALLLEHLTGMPALKLRLDTDTRLPDATAAAYADLIRRRAGRVPLQWLTGRQSFCGIMIAVSPDVLIPRPETAMLVERTAALGQGRNGYAVLDLCTGSGCIAIACSHMLPNACVTACDLSPEALAVARRNAKENRADIRFLQGDLFAAVGDERFDVIVSNPPYIPSANCASLQPEVTREPLMALDGGQDGLGFYRRIAAEAGAHLNPGGVLLLEVGQGEAEQAAKLLEDAGFSGLRIENDLAGIPRMVEGHRS